METLSKNFIWMAASNVVSSVFGIALFIYLARALGPTAFGYLSYAFTAVFFLYNFIDMGLSTYGMRAIAKHKTRATVLVSEIISLRFFLAALISLILIVLVSIYAKSHTIKALFIESSLLLIVFAFATEWAYQGLEDMRMVFISFASTSVLQFILIFNFVKSPQDLFRAPLLYFVGALPVIGTYLLRLKFTFRVRVADLRRMFSHLSGAIVLWMICIFAQVYNGLDVVLLGFFRPMEEVGCFTVSRRVIGSIVVFMLFLSNAVLPRLSSSFSVDSAQFQKDLRKFMRLAAFTSIFILLPFGVFNKFFITLTVGPGYLASSPSLSIMTIGLIFVIFNLPFSTALIAGHMEEEVLYQAMGCAALSLILNFILMPAYGIIGASISFVIVEGVALLWIMLVYKQRGSKW